MQPTCFAWVQHWYCCFFLCSNSKNCIRLFNHSKSFIKRFSNSTYVSNVYARWDLRLACVCLHDNTHCLKATWLRNVSFYLVCFCGSNKILTPLASALNSSTLSLALYLWVQFEQFTALPNANCLGGGVDAGKQMPVQTYAESNRKQSTTTTSTGQRKKPNQTDKLSICSQMIYYTHTISSIACISSACVCA